MNKLIKILLKKYLWTFCIIKKFKNNLCDVDK